MTLQTRYTFICDTFDDGLPLTSIRHIIEEDKSLSKMMEYLLYFMRASGYEIDTEKFDAVLDVTEKNTVDDKDFMFKFRDFLNQQNAKVWTKEGLPIEGDKPNKSLTDNEDLTNRVFWLCYRMVNRHGNRWHNKIMTSCDCVLMLEDIKKEVLKTLTGVEA